MIALNHVPGAVECTLKDANKNKRPKTGGWVSCKNYVISADTAPEENTGKSRRIHQFKNQYEKIQSRKNRAKERQENWDKLTPKQKLNELDERLGVGKGAAKQRKKLTDSIKK